MFYATAIMLLKPLASDTRGVAFNIMNIIFMFVAIWLGTVFGAGFASMLGFGGGLIGALVVGFIVYVIYTLVSGGKIQLMQGIIFAVLVYVAQLVAGFIGGNFGLGGGLLGLGVSAIVLSFLWGWFGGKGKGIGKGRGKLF